MRPRSRIERFEIFMKRQKRHFAPIFAKMNKRLNDTHEKMSSQSRRVSLLQCHKICLAAGVIDECKRIQKELDGMDVYK